MLAEGRPRVISVSEAARLGEVPVRTFRRRMHALNTLADGRLLVRARHVPGERVGKWLVVLAVLEEVAPLRAKTRPATVQDMDTIDAEVRRAKARLDEVETRTRAHTKRLREHGRQIKKHRKAIDALSRAKQALIEAGEALASGAI